MFVGRREAVEKIGTMEVRDALGRERKRLRVTGPKIDQVGMREVDRETSLVVYDSDAAARVTYLPFGEDPTGDPQHRKVQVDSDDRSVKAFREFEGVAAHGTPEVDDDAFGEVVLGGDSRELQASIQDLDKTGGGLGHGGGEVVVVARGIR